MEPIFFQMDRIITDLYAMEPTSMTLILERANIMSHLSIWQGKFPTPLTCSALF